MYKEMLNKGFKPIYYTNGNWFESRDCKTRLFYRYDVTSKTLFKSMLNILNIFDKYFWILQEGDLEVQIETDENAEEFWIYFCNYDVDNYQIPQEILGSLFSIIPNEFEFENSDD